MNQLKITDTLPRVSRGGSRGDDGARVRAAFLDRIAPSHRSVFVGFRCALRSRGHRA